MNFVTILAAQVELPLWLTWLVVLLVLVIGAARLTRVVTYDDFPPTIALRIWWDKHTEDSLWNKLLHCHWCFGIWATALAGGTLVLGLLWFWVGVAWLALWGLLALGYLVSIFVHHDEGKG